MSKNDYLVSNACFSDDGLYRYFLARVWDAQLPVLAFIMLNPSTADGETDDSTVKRCVSYAKQWGYGGIEIYNRPFAVWCGWVCQVVTVLRSSLPQVR